MKWNIKRVERKLKVDKKGGKNSLMTIATSIDVTTYKIGKMDWLV